MFDLKLLSNVSAVGALIILLGYLLKSWADSIKRERQNHENDRQSYEKLVDNIRTESKNREDKLMSQLDKYNCSLENNTECLKEISKNIEVIPQMREDIEYLKEKVK